MLRPMVALAACLAGFQALPAQDPAANPDPRLAGSWKLDRAASDSVPQNLRALVSAQPIAIPGTPRVSTQSSRTVVGSDRAAGGGPVTIVGTAPGGRVVSSGTLTADGYIRSGSSQGDTSSAGNKGPQLLVNGAGQRVAPAQVELLLAEVAPARMVLAINGGKTIITADDGTAQEWITDKKAHRLVEGAVAVQESSWFLKSLQTIRTIDNGSEVKRDFKVSSDGKTLEVKTQVKVGGKKTELKLKYTRTE